jgi:hypothetical protein
MAQSPEEIFQAALATFMLERDSLTPDDFIGDYLIIVETSSPLRPAATAYALIQPNPDGLPLHRAYGLLDVASNMVESE